ncbi:UNVERIFIED_CONTAM: hypothetical protein Slati_2364700 [Sesamum latifolium]|uniref:Uncharacterized protein n=1 Tax=Sesamum latifolium TaxID=2727402 RepID=A0AAW2WB26_9LAMI
MMVVGQINGKEIKALVDTGTTDNFISNRIVHKLGLDVKLCDGQVKAVNSEAMPVSGVATTELRAGSWSGQYDFMAVRLDDFDVILGIDFFIVANVMILPKLGGIFISGGNKSAFMRGEEDVGGDGQKMAKAQQDCEAGPELFTYADVLKHERECEGKHSVNVRGEKRALVQSTSGKKEGKTAASTRASTSVGGVVCKPLKKVRGLMRQACAWDSAVGVGTGRHKVYAGSRQAVQGLLACVGAMAQGRGTAYGTMLLKLRNDWVIVRTMSGVARMCGVGRPCAHNTRPSTRPMGTDGRTVANDLGKIVRAGADGLGTVADSMRVASAGWPIVDAWMRSLGRLADSVRVESAAWPPTVCGRPRPAGQ